MSLTLMDCTTIRFTPFTAALTAAWGRPRLALALCLPLLWLTGCVSNIPAPVENRDQGGSAASRSIPEGVETYTVGKGDTMYSIAWRYGLDYQKLANWNGIDSSYRIYPGQQLRLQPGGEESTVIAAAPQPEVSKPEPLPGSTTTSRPASQAAASKPAPQSKPKPASKPAAAKPTKKTPPAKPKPQVAAKKPKPKPKPKPAPATGGGKLKWAWPTKGKVVQTFVAGDRTRQGIRIAGKAGQPILAAEAGKVVYTGSGLPGYGKLIIVKHNKNYLSAYGFNRKLLVKDGDQVAKGERVAEMGQSTDGKTLLHFEIRRRDKPLDPLKRLPR